MAGRTHDLRIVRDWAADAGQPLGPLVRPRLLEVLASRFDRRLTLVQAGPGFGKTTLLTQALHEHALSPIGTDVFVALRPVHRDREVLARSLFEALHIAPRTAHAGVSSEDLVTALSLTDLPTCVVLDHVDVLSFGSAGNALLVELIAESAPCVSFVLSARRLPPLGIRRHDLNGSTAWLRSHDLAYSLPEQALVASAIPVAYRDWPALVALFMAAGGREADAFITEEVLAPLGESDRRRLAALVVLGGTASAELLAHALDEPPGACDEIADSCAVTVAERELTIRAVVARLLGQPFDDGAITAIRSRASDLLLAQSQFDRAIRLRAACSDWDGVAEVADRIWRSGWPEVEPAAISAWSELFPHSEQERPESKLLRGIAARESNLFGTDAASLLSEAAAGFAARGSVGSEVAALCEQAFTIRERGELDVLAMIMFRLMELDALGHPEVVGPLILGRAVLAEALDDDATLLAELQQLTGTEFSNEWMSRVEWLRGHSTLMLGRPRDGLAHTLNSAALTPEFLAARYLDAYARWWDALTPEVLTLLPDIGSEPRATPYDRVYGGTVLSTVLAFVGEQERARAGMRVARQGAQADVDRLGAIRPEYQGLLAFGDAAIAIGDGGDAAAADAIRSFLEQCPPDQPVGRRTTRRWSGLAYVLVPETRAAIDGADYGPSFADVRSIAQWFVALREGRSTPCAVDPIPRILHALPFRWAVEAACRAHSGDSEVALLVTRRLAELQPLPTRSILRAFADDASLPWSGGAKALLAAVAIAPTAPVRLDLLGPLVVTHGDHVSAVPELRRERARQVISALALTRTLRREVLTDRLWPEADAAAGSQSLRTTLTYVQKILEPDRRAGEASFVLSVSDDQLELAAAPWVTTDLAEFESRLDDAMRLRATGAHSLECEALESALLLVRGEPLVDVQYLDWAVDKVRALTIAIAGAAERAGGLRSAMGYHRRAEEHAALALRFDPFSHDAGALLVESLLGLGRHTAARAELDAWSKRCADAGVAPPSVRIDDGRLIAVRQ
jgi:LuxR family transcriptional regulator, maltose regulon positive regulatory protein